MITWQKFKPKRSVLLSLAVVWIVSSPVCFAETATNTASAPQALPMKQNATADWTAFLQNMQNGCDLPDFANTPAPLLASITNLDDNTAKNGYKTLNLKNATAWGYPIKKIQYGAMGAGFSSATIYFTNSNFLKLRPKFYLNTVSGKLKASDKTVIQDPNAFAGQALANGMGYNDGRVGVNFSKKTNSITCSWAHLTG